MDASARVVIRREVVINLCTNIGFNALCAWLIERHKPFVPMSFWGVCIDTWITCHFVCLFVTSFAAMAARRHFASGAFKITPAAGRLLRDLPRRPLLLALTMAELSAVILMPCLGFFFLFSGIEALSIPQYAFYKGAWAGTLGGVVCFAVLRRYLDGGVLPRKKEAAAQHAA